MKIKLGSFVYARCKMSTENYETIFEINRNDIFLVLFKEDIMRDVYKVLHQSGACLSIHTDNILLEPSLTDTQLIWHSE